MLFNVDLGTLKPPVGGFAKPPEPGNISALRLLPVQGNVDSTKAITAVDVVMQPPSFLNLR